ncbi:MAG: Co2+/Mg2+ efflux protein ApaG [Planctomycetes bacterium]|jgi:ApaG protein|nr:Co2+/Mg2+ efflux protein ApaG [Planctomycetota bacterium]MCC7065801.1 Co2+/Mg2+ efflux protein ApaG [Planctomycetota bacterium]
MTNTPHSETTTDGIRIHAAAQFLPGESEPQNKRYVFAYKITMTNVDSAPAKLVSRHWVIVDSEGRREEVRGRGVVGEYPKLAPGESYSYVSYSPIGTKWGTMEGSYTFVRDDGTRFQVAIGRFFLVPTAPPLVLESPSR